MLIKITNRILLPSKELMMATASTVIARRFIVSSAPYNKLYYNKQSSSLVLASFKETLNTDGENCFLEAFELSREQTVKVITSTELKLTRESARYILDIGGIQYFNSISDPNYLRGENIVEIDYLYSQIDKGL